RPDRSGACPSRRDRRHFDLWHLSVSGNPRSDEYPGESHVTGGFVNSSGTPDRRASRDRVTTTSCARGRDALDIWLGRQESRKGTDPHRSCDGVATRARISCAKGGG